MKKFSFSLQGLLNARAAQKTAIEHELAVARQRYNAEKEQLRQLEELFERTLEAPLPSPAPAASDFLMREKYLTSLKRKRREQQVKVDAADAAIKVCLSKLRQADIELKKVEKLEERERSGWEIEKQRDDQKISDEIGTSRTFYRPRAS